MQTDNQNSVWNLVQELNNKRGITEVAINDINKVFVERDGEFIQLKVDISEADIKQFINDVAQINNKVCDKNNPILDGSLPDGSRINIIVPPYVYQYPAITIRKYIRTIKSFQAGEQIFGIHDNAIKFFQSLVKSRCNLIISGGTGVGKTTFLNLLMNELDPNERIITIEDTFELNLNISNVVKLISRKQSVGLNGLSTRELVKNSLRMRPDRIIIGEVRGEEVFDLLQAMNTGHEGSMSSVHANDARECIRRLETLFLLAGYDVPLKAVRFQIASAIDYIIQLKKTRDGNRVVGEVYELTGIDADAIQMQKIAEFKDERFAFTGLAPSNIDKLAQDGGLNIDFFA